MGLNMQVLCVTSDNEEILEDLSDRQAVLHLLERVIYDHRIVHFDVKVKEMPASDFNALMDIPEFDLPNKPSLVDDL
jgi:hypothetical protein